MKNTKRARITSAILAGMLATGTLLTGCSSAPADNGGGASGTASGADNSSKTQAEIPATMEVGVMTPHFGTLPTEKATHQKWEQMMNEKLGTTIKWNWSYVPYAEYTEKANVALASNDFPDLFTIMNKNVATPYTSQDMFVELSQYQGLTPNYLEFVKSVRYGEDMIKDGDGKYYGFQNGEIPRLEKGVGIYTSTSYRYDIFEKEKIAIPKTTEEFYQAAKKLKEIYPSSYPVSRVGWSSSETKTFKTSTDFFWNGKEYEYGPVTENYKDMLTYLNKLYSEGLLDPESFTEDNDAHTKKALNGTNFMQLGQWFTNSFEWNLNEESDAYWVNALSPSDAKYGDAWQDVSNVNDPIIQNGLLVINTESKYIEPLIKLVDLQYSPEVIELLTWGIEGESFVRDADGNPTFVDEIKKAENPWKAGDKWGMRASASTRPGLQCLIDTKAFIDFAPNDPCYIDGKIVDMPWEKAFPDESWPDSKLIPPNTFAPPISFTPDESQQKSNAMTAVQTYMEESQLQFIKGDLSFDKWDAYVKQIEDMGYKTVLDMYNAKASAIVK